jgi:vang-like
MIEKNFEFQDENWGETTTAVTVNSDLDYEGMNTSGGFNSQHPAHGPELDKWKLDTERGISFRLRRHFGPFVAGLLSMLAFLSPILMAGLPKIGVLGLKSHQVNLF